MGSGAEHNAGRGVGLRGDPGAVERVNDQHEGDDAHESNRHFALNATSLLFQFLKLPFAFHASLGGTARVHALNVLGQQVGDGNAGQDTHHGGQDQHKSDHDAGKVNTGDTVQNDEDVRVGELREAEVQASGEQKYQDLTE